MPMKHTCAIVVVSIPSSSKSSDSAWGDPTDPARRDEYVLEAFWRMQIAPGVDLARRADLARPIADAHRGHSSGLHAASVGGDLTRIKASLVDAPQDATTHHNLRSRNAVLRRYLHAVFAVPSELSGGSQLTQVTSPTEFSDHQYWAGGLRRCAQLDGAR